MESVVGRERCEVSSDHSGVWIVDCGVVSVECGIWCRVLGKVDVWNVDF